MSQNSEILNALQHGDKLTPLDALTRFGCMRLSARIYDLREKGHDVKVRMKQIRRTTHGVVEVAEYSLSS